MTPSKIISDSKMTSVQSQEADNTTGHCLTKTMAYPRPGVAPDR